MWLNNIIALLTTRHIRSFYYRIILVVYGLAIFVLFPNLFPLWVYIVALIAFILFYIHYFTSNSDSKSWIRTLIDISFIGICLFGKPLDNIAIITMLFFPIANAINHTGRFCGRGSKLFILWMILLYFLLLGAHKAVELSDFAYAAVAFAGLFFIHCNTFRDWSHVNKRAELYDTIDKLYMYESNYSEVYKNMIDICSEGNDICKFILCFASYDNFQTTHIINGSKFITSYTLFLDEREKSLLAKEKVVYNSSVSIEGQCYRHCLLIPQKIHNKSTNSTEFSYLFILIFQNRRISYKKFEVALDTSLFRLSNYFYAQHRIKQRKLAYYEQIKKKNRFVDSAINAMHFIKNRLTPVQTLIDLINDNDLDLNKDDVLRLIKETAHRSQIDINQIVVKSAYLLNKDNNPFFYQIVEDVNPMAIFESLDTIWANVFPNIPINVNPVSKSQSEVGRIGTNLEALEILFSDIIGNMIKYQKDYSSCHFLVNSDSVEIAFQNDFVDRARVTELVKSYNENNRTEILKRKTYGVSSIKSIVENLNIELKSDISNTLEFNEVFQLKLIFKIKEYENINH